MSDAAEAFRGINAVLFTVLGMVTAAMWQRTRDPAARWATVTFSVLAAVLLAGLLIPAGDAPMWVREVQAAVALLFPYALFRFGGAFVPWPRLGRMLADATFAGMLVWTLAFPSLVPLGAPREGVTAAYVAAFVVFWVSLSLAVAMRLGRAGRGQPTLARRRMRLLAAASLIMSAAVIGAGAEAAAAVMIQALVMASGLAFAVALAPPGALRVAWRQPEERELYNASVRLMGATSREDVAQVLLPRVGAVIGALGVRVVDPVGEVIGAHGRPDAEGELRTYPLSGGTLEVRLGRYTPFFGEEEERLLRRLTLLAELALDRVDLLGREQDAREALEHANEDLEAFVYSASHDLKNPLVAMLGYLELFEADYKDRLDDQATFYLDRIGANGRFMSALIADLLELSRVGRSDTETERVDLAPLVSELAGELRLRHPEVTVEVGALPVVRLNPTRARQLFANLLDNAAKYGGRPDLTVEVRSQPLDDGGVLIRVIDDGLGVPEPYRDRIFGVFERVPTKERERTGTGIGLAICRKIAEGAGGRIWIAPTEVGAEFRIDLPVDVVLEGADAGAAPTERPRTHG